MEPETIIKRFKEKFTKRYHKLVVIDSYNIKQIIQETAKSLCNEINIIFKYKSDERTKELEAENDKRLEHAQRMLESMRLRKKRKNTETDNSEISNKSLKLN